MQLLTLEVVKDAVLVVQVEGIVRGQLGYTSGTAFFVPQGILTAYHTLQRAGENIKIFVYHPDIGECRAELIAKDESKDLALLRLKTRRKRSHYVASELCLPSQDTIAENTPIFAIASQPHKHPVVVGGMFAKNVDPLEERLLMSETELTPDPQRLRASFHNMFCPAGFSGGPLVTADGSLVSVISTWHAFFMEVRGATLPQLRQFLLSTTEGA